MWLSFDLQPALENMPVQLPPPNTDELPPRPPRPVIWAVCFAVFILVGVLSTLLTWPKTEPTATPWFWLRLFVFPALAWCVVFGLRKHLYDDELERLKAEDAVREEDRAKAIRFASEPLAVLGHAYLCAMGSVDAATQLSQGNTLLKARQFLPVGLAAQSSKEPMTIRVTSLDGLAGKTRVERCRSAFERLLKLIDESVSTVPSHVPLDVRLQLPGDMDANMLLALWRVCWQEQGLRAARARLVENGRGLMTLDEWLDVWGGPELERVALFVSLQLHDTPPHNSAEAGVALLLGWAPLAQRCGLAPIAMLHRPVEVISTSLEDALGTSLLWGNVTAPDINDLWQTGLEKSDKSALLKGTPNPLLGLARKEDLSGVHDIDLALGHAGAAAGWLATAMAIENASTHGEPQLIAWREGTLRFSVAQPATQKSTSETRA